MEKLLEEISFAAPDQVEKQVTITAEYVRSKLTGIIQDRDLSRYVL
jgi:ATP-dependent HslUV protease ATP-binding subunit HslU